MIRNMRYVENIKWGTKIGPFGLENNTGLVLLGKCIKRIFGLYAKANPGTNDLLFTNHPKRIG